MKHIDLFGTEIKLLLNNREKVQTKIGGYMSILLIIVAVFLIYEIGKDIFFKKNPTSLFQRQMSDYFQEIELNRSDVPITFSFTDEMNQLINITNYLEVEIYYMRYELMNKNIDLSKNFFNETKKEKMNYRICDENHFNEKIDRIQYEKSQMAKYFCISDYGNKTLKGYWDEDEVSYISLSVKKCNTTKNIDCKNTNITNFIKDNQLNINFNLLRPQVEFEIHKNPVNYIIYNSYFYLSTSLRKRLFFRIEKHKLNSDEGLFYKSINEIDFYDSYLIDYDFMDSENELISAEFYSSNTYNQYNRKYITITDIFAKIGGVLSFLPIIFRYINSYFVHYRVIETIINSIFFVDSSIKSSKINSFEELFKIDLNNTNNIPNNNQNISQKYSKINNYEILKGVNKIHNGTKDKNSKMKIDDCSSFRHLVSKKIILENPKFETHNQLKPLKNLYKNNLSTVQKPAEKSNHIITITDKEIQNKKIYKRSNQIIDLIKDQSFRNSLNQINMTDSYPQTNKLDNNENNIDNNEKEDNDKIKQSTDNLIDKLKKQKKANLNLNFCEMINVLKIDFFKSKHINKNNKYNLLILFQGEKKIIHYLNLANIIKTLENVNFLTGMLFKDYQKNVLKIINKPLLQNPINYDLSSDNGREIILSKSNKDELEEKDIKNIIKIFLINYEKDKNLKNDLIHKILNKN